MSFISQNEITKFGFSIPTIYNPEECKFIKEFEFLEERSSFDLFYVNYNLKKQKNDEVNNNKKRNLSYFNDKNFESIKFNGYNPINMLDNTFIENSSNSDVDNSNNNPEIIFISHYYDS
jgi:hypothetical protein